MSSYDFEMYEKGVDTEDLFDWTVFGALIRNKRRKKGYKTAEEFSHTIYNRTRFTISAETLYKIEGGKQVPNAMQLMAICMSVNWSPQIGDLFAVCASNEWNEVASGAVPLSWRRENAAYYALETGAPAITTAANGTSCAIATNAQNAARFSTVLDTTQLTQTKSQNTKQGKLNATFSNPAQ